VNIKEIPLNVNLGHAGQCAMVLVQPKVELVLVPQEGYRIANHARAASREMVSSVCTVSNRAISGMALCQDYDDAHFIVLPELSVTTDGLAHLEDYVKNACPNNTLVILGLEGIPWNEFNDLLTRSNNPQPQYMPPEGTVDWVNCCVTLVKLDTGEAQMYVQSKFRESQWEENPGRVFRGEDLLLFRLMGTHGEFNFVSLICSDFTAEHDGRTTVERALESISRCGLVIQKLDVVFGLQHNKSLSSPPFPLEIATILNWNRDGLTLQHSALIFQNAAGPNNFDEGNYGDSSFFFPRNQWKIPTRQDDPQIWYKARQWPEDCRHFSWRINQPLVCIVHYLPIESVGMAAGAARLPFEHVRCYEISNDGTLRDPTTSGLHIQWQHLLNKVIPFSASLCRPDNTGAGAIDMQEFETWLLAHTSSSKMALFNASRNRLIQISELLFKCQRNMPSNYDYWTEHDQGRAMANVVHATTLMKLIDADVRFDAGLQYTAVIDEQFNLAVLDGNDQVTHSQMLERYYRESEDHPWGDYSTLILLARSATFEPWEKATPQTGQYTDPISADFDIGDENPHFSPKPRFIVGFLERMQTWRAIPTRAGAEAYIRSYVGKI
jgi:hypothetical protein